MYSTYKGSVGVTLIFDQNNALNYYSYNTVKDKIFYYQEVFLILIWLLYYHHLFN